MASVNMVIRKGYLLAEVVMAANMLVVNEMKAMKEETNENNEEKNQNNKQFDEVGDGEKINIDFYFAKCEYIGFLTMWKNTINLVGEALFTFANGLYNFYDNKPSFYFDYYFAGWNSNPFAKGYLQFCPNINFGRGIFWLVMGYLTTYLLNSYCEEIRNGTTNKNARHNVTAYFITFKDYTPWAIGSKLCNIMQMEGNNLYFIYHFIRLLQNFVSIPLIINFTSKFTISIAFDSIIWIVMSHFTKKGKNTKKYRNKLKIFIKARFNNYVFPSTLLN